MRPSWRNEVTRSVYLKGWFCPWPLLSPLSHSGNEASSFPSECLDDMMFQPCSRYRAMMPVNNGLKLLKMGVKRSLSSLT